MEPNDFSDQLGAHDLEGAVLGPNDILTDVIVMARATNMTDGETRVLLAHTVGMDIVTKLGLVEAVGQSDSEAGVWTWTPLRDEGEQ